MADKFNLKRFIDAQMFSYDIALSEIRAGRKDSHWMWYIFPQMEGLGRSWTAEEYAIHSLEEAAAYLNDPYLGRNLIEISSALIELDTDDAIEVFGYTDARKLRSCMTLFSLISEEGSVFHQVLDKYFRGIPDRRTLSILGKK